MTQTLVDYAKQLRQRDCPVCQLNADIRSQMRAATDKGIRRNVTLAWLRDVHKAELTNEQLNAHYSGKHDDG